MSAESLVPSSKYGSYSISMQLKGTEACRQRLQRLSFDS